MSVLIELNRLAVEHSVPLVGAVTADQLALPTPCADWNVGDLVGHMIAQHRGFAYAAAGGVDDETVWRVQPLGDDPAADYAGAAERVVEAFAADGVLSADFWLPEIRNGGPFPGRLAVGFHLVDYVVHGWDVAVSIGAATDYQPDVVLGALGIAEQVPNGAERGQPGASFAPALASDQQRSPMDRLLMALGRDPYWPGASSS